MACGDCGSMNPSSSAVDCTLSLGTPSTRHSEKIYWDILSKSNTKHTNSGATGTPASNGFSSLGGDSLLLARRCANCNTTSTPLWRNGPTGPKSLCNACGIRYKKEERRAAASPAVADQVTCYDGYQGPAVPQQPRGCYESAKDGAAAAGRRKHSGYVEANATADVPCHSWRFNAMPSVHVPVRDLPTLFH